MDEVLALENAEHNAPPASLLRCLFEDASDAIFVVTCAGEIAAVNQTACDLFGYSKEEFLAMSAGQMSAPEYAAAFPARIAQIRQEGKHTFEIDLLHRDGSRIPVEMHLRLLHHDGNELILNICRDIRHRRQREVEYKSIIQATGDGYWMVQVSDASIIDVNDTFCRMVGYSREELLTMKIPDLEAIEDPEDTAAHIRKVMEEGHDIFETKHRHKDGHVVDFEISVSYADIRGGVIFVFTRDISERKRQEAELRLAAMTFEASTAAIIVTDANNLIVGVNPAFTQITGYEADEVLGRNPRLLQSGRQNRAFYQKMWREIHDTGRWEGEWWNRRKNGEEYAEHVVMNLVRNSDGSIYRYVKISSDITEKKHATDLIWRKANFDAVTNLPNRAYFTERLGREAKQCIEGGQQLALYFIDLDHFKEINDELGHDTGDQVLAEAARRISGCVRGTDMVARLGGDEFTIIVSGLHDPSRVEAVARKVIDVLARPFYFNGHEKYLSGSVGIAMFPDDTAEVGRLMKLADQAMYVAKRSGKNRYCYAKDSAAGTNPLKPDQPSH